jgi:cytochrome P450
MHVQATDTAPPSMARAMLEEGGDLETIKAVTGIAYLAGSDTTVAAIVSFFLAMLVYPEVQAKGQAEVDRVVGTSRLPELADVAAMPYVQSIASECLRWLPVAPIGTLPLCYGL